MRDVRRYLISAVLSGGAKRLPRLCVQSWQGLRFLLALGASWLVGASALAAPTVNGLFFGDGDFQRYTRYNTSEGGSGLYYNLSSNRLYVALVVSRAVNDNVFGNRAYTRHAGWSPGHTAKRMTDSEFAEFSLTIGGQSWVWRQGYGAQPGGSANNASPTWYSSHKAGAGSGTPPPGYLSSSSLVWNLNTYATNSCRAWNMNVNGTTWNDWKSPFAVGAPDVVVGLEGYPAAGQIGFSETYQWEWPMVYEWSVDLSGFDPAPIFLITGLSHHSPAKNDSENDPFPSLGDAGEPAALMDFGDLPETFATSAAHDGARHYLVANGAFLGVAADPEPDGLPFADADGDDVNGSADEDGVQFLTPPATGADMQIRVTAGTPGYLSAFFGYADEAAMHPAVLKASAGPAALEPGNMLDLHVPAAGVYTLTVRNPGRAAATAARFRFTNEAGQGGASPSGLALTGEVEDYMLPVSPLSAAVELTAYATKQGVVLDLYTVDEAGQGDLVVYAWVNGVWREVGRVPASEVAGEGSNKYRLKASGLAEGESYRFKVIDEVGNVFHLNATVKVRAIKARGLRFVAGALELAFDTEMGRSYLVKMSENLSAPEEEWAKAQVSLQTQRGWTAYSTKPFMAGAGERSLVRIRTDSPKAFFKIVLVGE